MKKYTLRKENRDAVILLILVIVVIVVITPFVLREKDNTEEALSPAKTNRYYAQPGKNDGSRPADADCELFDFDPNTADSTTLLRLGLQPWQVRNIYKYRSMGGRYHKKEDFARLYGLTLEKYRQLEPYIKIKADVMAADVIKSEDKYAYTAHNREDNVGNARTTDNHEYQKLRPGQTVDINTADTTELKKIPGIGSYFAQRIVDLRKRRQAFVSPEELLQGIRNFPETAIAYMTASQNFAQIHINRIEQKELSRHPLINYTQARDIMTLRRTTGKIRSINDMSMIASFTEEQLKRLSKFIIFD